MIFVSAILSSADNANSQTATQAQEADRLVQTKDNNDVDDTGLKIGKTPIELQNIAINSPIYSSYWGDSSMLGFGSAPIPTCFYNWAKASVNSGFFDSDHNQTNSSIDDSSNIDSNTMKDLEEEASTQIQVSAPLPATDTRSLLTITAPLVVNNFMTSGKSREILFGITDLKYCPLPGSTIFNNYNRAVSGEFLLTGAICVINSILFDAMFKIYCTIIIWFYSIMYAMIIIYIMFYGMALMLGIGQDPIREAPKKVLKIVILFILVTNAQVGFRYVHTFFITTLNSFSSMLADMQTITDDAGGDAYQGKLSEFYGAFKSLGVDSGGATNGNSLEDIFIKKGKLLNTSGDVWRPLDNGEVLNALNNAGAGGFNVPLAPGYQASDEVTGDNYVPFRVPNQQWQYTPKKEVPPGSPPGTPKVVTYTIEPVYMPLSTRLGGLDPNLKACVLDFRYAPDNENDQAWEWVIRPYLRCPKDNNAMIPYFLPYGVYCLYDPRIRDANPDKFEVGNPDSTGKPNPVIECNQGSLGARTQLIRLKNEPGNLTEECNEYKNFFASIISSTGSVIKLKPCRSGFQGIFAKADTLISGMIGGDRSKGIGGLLGAFAAWSVGGGLLLSIFMMTGFFAITFVAIQVVWTFVTAIMALSFLLMISPIFISFLLFKTTEKLFRGWLNSVISFTLQPILLLAFVFFISAITSVDKINYLMREELTSKTMVVGGAGENDKKMTMKMAGFVEPLYEKPEDFDTFYYDNSTKSDPRSTLITAKQRDRYLEKKGKAVLETFFNNHPKFGYKSTSNGDIMISPQIYSPEASKFYAEVMNLWDNGVYPIAMPAALNPPDGLLGGKYRGIAALQEYVNMSLYSGGFGGTQPWFGAADPAHQTAANANYGTRVIEEIISFYTQGGCFFSGCDTSPTSNFTANSCYSASCTGSNWYNGLVPGSYNTSNIALRTSIDDGDSFVGEPRSLNGQYWSWGPGWQTWVKDREYPVCKRFCPQFNPKFEPLNTNKPWLANPNINTPPTTTMPDGASCTSYETQADGSPCPDIDGDNKPDKCYTPNCYGWKCEKYCMYIKNAQKVLYRDVLSAILSFILINMVAAAFLSKVPELAAALSNWAPGQHAVRIGGGSRIMGQKGGDAWTQAEMSEVYSVGGILSMDPQRPGTILGLLNKATSMAGLYEVVGADGSITKAKAGVLDIMNSGGLLGGGARNAQKSQRDADLVNSFKGIFKLSKSESFSTDKLVNKDDLDVLSRFIKPKDPESWQKIFEQFRAANSTGLKHSEIWDIIQRNLGRSPNPEVVKQAIMSEIQELIQKKIPDELKKTTK